MHQNQVSFNLTMLWDFRYRRLAAVWRFFTVFLLTELQFSSQGRQETGNILMFDHFIASNRIVLKRNVF